MHRHCSGLPSLSPLGAGCPLAADATSFSGNGWTVDLSEYVNASHVTTSCPGDALGGTALAGEALGCGGQKDRTTIGNGLLPTALITKFTTSQEGFDISALVGIMVRTATSDALSANSGVDVRRGYFTVGTPVFGVVKLGRDHGVFGSTAIHSDMTLPGVGTPVQVTH